MQSWHTPNVQLVLLDKSTDQQEDRVRRALHAKVQGSNIPSFTQLVNGEQHKVEILQDIPLVHLLSTWEQHSEMKSILFTHRAAATQKQEGHEPYYSVNAVKRVIQWSQWSGA
jgi:hypothetical protein